MTGTRFIDFLLKVDRLEEISEAVRAIINAQETKDFIMQYSDDPAELDTMDEITRLYGRTLLKAYKAYTTAQEAPEDRKEALRGVLEYISTQGNI